MKYVIIKTLGALIIVLHLVLGVSSLCTNDSLAALKIPSNFTTDMLAGDTLNTSETVTVQCANSSMVTDLGRFIVLTCQNTTFTGAPTTWPQCREPRNCSDLSPDPPVSSGLGQTNETAQMEGDTVTYYCKNPWYKIKNETNYFELACGSNGTFPTNLTWPTCTNPIPPLSACQCLGDPEVANYTNSLLNGFCRNNTMPGYLNPPARKRCGSRNLNELTVDNFCYCDSVQTAGNQSYWFTIRLLTGPWEWFLDYSTKLNKSFLTQPNSKVYLTTKLQIEQAIDAAVFNSSIATGYVQSQLVNFIQGKAVPKGVFPKIRPPTTTTAPPATTTTANLTAAGNATTNATTTSSTATTTTVATATTTTVAGRRKRQVSTASGYTYVNVLLNSLFMTQGKPTLAQFTTFFNSLATVNGGSINPEVKIDAQCPNDICNVQNVSTCSNNFLNTISSNYDITTRYGVYKPITSPNVSEAGDMVELRCKQSLGPVKYPLLDQFDSDPTDHTIMTYCTYPQSPGPGGQFALTASTVPPCTPICTNWFPTPDDASDLKLINITPVAAPNTMLPVANISDDANFFLFSGDKLVYQCQTPQTSVYGGSNETTSFFGCTDQGIYNTPKSGLWPKCLPELNIVIAGVRLTLETMDTALSDQNKLIGYQDADNLNKVVVPMNYFTNITVPVLISLVVFILICCFCTSKGSPVCRLCEPKA